MLATSYTSSTKTGEFMSYLRFFIKIVSWVLTLRLQRRPYISVLMYHRVTGDVNLELDLPFKVFKEQMIWLSHHGRVVSLDYAISKLLGGGEFLQPHFVVTFDDAYDDFFTLVFPLMKELGLPVTLYVPTGFIESPNLPPVSKKNTDTIKLRPVSWDDLREMANSYLLTIGSHTHTHREMVGLDNVEIMNEVKKSDLLIYKNVGLKVRHFAYPRGVWNTNVENILKDRYSTITLTTGGVINPLTFLPHRLPRLPILRSDGMFWFKSRVSGRLIYEEISIKYLKKIIIGSNFAWKSLKFFLLGRQ